MKEEIRWSSMFIVPELQETYDRYQAEKLRLARPAFSEEMLEELELRLRHAEHNQYTVTLVVYDRLGAVGHNGFIKIDTEMRRIKVWSEYDVNWIPFDDILGVIPE